MSTPNPGTNRRRIRHSEEVARWIRALTPRDALRVSQVIQRATTAPQLRMPWAKSLGDGLFEFRFALADSSGRITFIYGPDNTIITLTAFVKTARRNAPQISRARAAQQAYYRSERKKP